VAVRILADERRTVAHVALRPADGELRAFERFHAPFQGVLAARAKSHVDKPRLFGGGELQGVAFVIVVSAQIDGVALTPALGHSHNVDKEAHALVEFGRKHFDMAQVGDISDRFVLHANLKVYRVCYSRCAGVGRWRHLRCIRRRTFSSSSEPKNPAKAVRRCCGGRRERRISRCRNWSVTAITALPMGRYSWVPWAHARPRSASIHSANPM